ncbi:hypothetical protein JCM24511_07748 [Saitozyma sp. JCM 24511]|nr:hypothetical protein JCM24511_07748 [Saitozyma sp. JCM 24511]
MVISVTTHEQRETITTWLNGQPVRQEEVTKIYVIEPMGPEGEGASDQLPQRRKGMLVMWTGLAAVWSAWIWWEFA